MEPFDPRLDEAILAEPSARDPWLVLADFLEGHGHPRAELIRIGLALETRYDSALQRDELERIETHRAALADWPTSVHCQWWRGFVATATCLETEPTAWPALAAHRSLRFVRALHVAGTAIRFDDTPAPASLQLLELDAAQLTSIDWPRLGRLTCLIVRAPDAVEPVPAVARLHFEQCTDAFVHALIEQLPALVRGGVQSLTVDCLTAAHASALVRSAHAFPALELHARPDAITDATLAALHASLPGWRADAATTDVPQKTLRDFVVESNTDVSEHPELGATAERTCPACSCIRTRVISVRDLGYPLGINDCYELEYERVCLGCGQFSVASVFITIY
ncbi:MAG: TIGR02996 domain-containing protein [Kofleriaceae bacterium]